MKLISFTEFPQFREQCSGTGRGRAALLTQKYSTQEIIFPEIIKQGMEIKDEFGERCFILKKVSRPKNYDTIDFSRMNKAGVFIVVLQTKMNTLKVLELILVV